MNNSDKSKYKTHPHNMVLSEKWVDFDGHSQIKNLSDAKEKDATVCVYKAEKGHSFDWHFHDCKESAMVFGEMILYVGEFVDFPNGESMIKIIEKVTYVSGEAYYLQPGVPHKVEFIENTCLIIGWYPAFKNNTWQATWTTQEEMKEVNDLYEQLKEKINKSF